MQNAQTTPEAAIKKKRLLPRHVGFIPDGNRRWAVQKGLEKQDGYKAGIMPGLTLVDACIALGIEEISVFGFTQDNTKRPSIQQEHFSKACVEFALEVARRDKTALLVLGDDKSPMFPDALKPFTVRQGTGMKVNLLVNYGWKWDLNGIKTEGLRSHEVSRLDLIVRWGGGRRLSGFLPVQSVYADIYIVDAYWPDFELAHIKEALAWFEQQDQTLGG